MKDDQHRDPSDPSAKAEVAARGTPSPLRRLTLPSLAAIGGVVALERLRTSYQQRRMFLPARLEDASTAPASVGLPAEDHWLTTEDGVQLHGWWVPHQRPRATVLFCHGNTGNLGSYLSVFAYLRRLKVNIFAFDYRGYGRSGGHPTEAGLARDARAAWRHLIETMQVAPQQIVVFGHSLGGAVAIELADDRSVHALIVQSSFTDMRAIARLLFPPASWMARNGFRSIDKVGRLAMPKLFIHGEADQKIPLAMGRALFDAATNPKDWYAVPGAGHNNVHQVGRSAYLRVLRRFLDDNLDDA